MAAKVFYILEYSACYDVNNPQENKTYIFLVTSKTKCIRKCRKLIYETIPVKQDRIILCADFYIKSLLDSCVKCNIKYVFLIFQENINVYENQSLATQLVFFSVIYNNVKYE